MSGEIDWDIDSLRFMVIELNKKGIEVKNKVANIFWQFRYQVTPYWTGYNCNRVLEHVNEYVDEFKYDTSNLAYDIPRRMEDWINMQAEAGGGHAERANLISAYDTGNSEIWAVPLTDETSDGATKISIEKMNQFFIGTTDPSVRGEIELAKQKLNEYIAIFDTYEQYTRNNVAAATSVSEVIDFQQRFIQKTDFMLEVFIEVAQAEINGIQQVDIDSIKLAVEQSQNGGQTPPGGNPDPCTGGQTPPGGNPDPCTGNGNGGSNGGGNKPTDPCAGNGNGYVDPCAGNGNGGSNGGGNKPTDPCAGRGGSNYVDPCAGRGSSSYVDPCGGQSGYTKASSTGTSKYVYDRKQDWRTMSADEKKRRAYMEAKSFERYEDNTSKEYISGNQYLSDSEKKEVEQLLDRSHNYVEPSKDYKPVSYDKTADWTTLSREQRVAKAYEDNDFVSKLSDSELRDLSEAQHTNGEHVYYEGQDNIYSVNPSKLNDRQRVQWAIDIRNDQFDQGLAEIGSDLKSNHQAYYKRCNEYLNAEQMAEVDYEGNYYAHMKGYSGNNAYYYIDED